MTRRQERLNARASARLLQDELWAVERGLRELLERWDRWSAGDDNDPWPQPWLDTGQRAMSLWYEHQGRLASTLDTASWSAVSQAFAAVAAFERVPARPEVCGPIHGQAVHKRVLDTPHYLVMKGVLALGRLAGRPLSEKDLDQPSFEDFMLDQGRRVHLDSQGGGPPI